MSDKTLSLDSKPHELKFGASFDPKSGVGYHSIRYDFKPASADTTQEAQLEVGQGHHVTLTVPHVEGSGKTHTVYKGNKRSVSKECVLIIDHDTGTFTLERLNNNINVKKTRMEGSSKAQSVGQPLTPVEKIKSSPGKVKSSQSPSAPVKQPSPPARLENSESVIGEISESSSNEDLSSDSESEPEDSSKAPTEPSSQDGLMGIIARDLDLSDTDSD